ncbi:MAG: M16 family metallopeptidase, partial [Saprospiraceae bacterium]
MNVKRFPQLWGLLLGSLLILGFTACQDAGSSDATTATPELKIDYEKFTLDNGLDVILHEDKSDPIVSVAIMYHVGSNREKPGRTGFAHFFEHMLFQNSENVGKGNFFKKIEELGGEFNGGTWNDGTVYYEVVPKDALEKILWMESDRMGFMINTVTTPVLENEKQVVKNEKRQRVDNQPYGHTGYIIDKTLYPDEHPYNWQVIGSLEDLQAATIDDVKEFYNQWYGANNATLVIAGDFDKGQTKEWVKKYFTEVPAREEVAAIQPQKSDLTATTKLMHEDNFAQLPELRMVYPTVEDGHPDSYALNYLGQLLSEGKRAPLYKELVEERQLAPAPASYNSTREIAGQFVVRVRANNDVDLDAVAEGINAAFSKFETNGIDDKDMQRIKNKLETDFYGGITSLLGKSFQLAQYNEFRGSPDELSNEIKKILAVSKDDVMRVYNQYIKGQPHLVTSFVPKGKAELAVEGSEMAAVVEEQVVAGAEAAPQEELEAEYEKTPSSFDRTVEPDLGEAPLVSVPKIWTANLDNGLEVYGIENSELPLVEFSLRLKGGMLLDDPSKIGVANLMTDIMQEGTANKTPEELEDAIGALGADISMSTSAEFITINASCLARNFAATMDLMEEMLL